MVNSYNINRDGCNNFQYVLPPNLTIQQLPENKATHLSTKSKGYMQPGIRPYAVKITTGMNKHIHKELVINGMDALI